MLLIFPLEAVQALFLSSLFLIWSVWIVNFRRFEEVCEIGAFVSAGVVLFPFLFKSFFLWWIWHFFQIFWSFSSFPLLYLLKAHMKLDGQKLLDEVEQRNSEKKSNVFRTEWQMCFFICWLLIPEQILWLEILTLIKWDVFLHLL